MPKQISPQPFDNHPAFYREDNRRNRGFNPTSKAFLEAKFSTLLPTSFVKNRRILDLGSGNGAAGHWALSKGAKHYTGVEVQKNYALQSRQLLAHWPDQVTIIQQDVRSYLQDALDNSFDLVLLAGMLYHFIDTKNIIDQACRIASEQVIVESSYPRGMRTGTLPLNLAITEYVTDQEVNLDTGDQSLLGISAATSLAALDLLFRLNRFGKQEHKLAFPLTPDTVIYNENLLGQSDLATRFAARYCYNPHQPPLNTLENNLSTQSGQTLSWENDPIAQAKTDEYQKQAASLSSNAKAGQWKFDAQVAAVFDGIARREIPDYLRVIGLCVKIINKGHLKQPKIIDVGSATGETLKQLHQAGYRALYGVEASEDMIKRSFDQATLIHSEAFPEAHGPFDYVLNNWTLHFIKHPLSYLEAIKRALAPGGILILSDKVSSSELTHSLYHDYKRSQGVTEAEIEKKRQQIEGILVTYPTHWYLNALSNLGFEQIEIINANAAFVTFMAIKPNH
ncbi:MAG: methyltransferase domain-containing protein [Leucothrix sp.]